MRVQMNVEPHVGYSADQIETGTTLQELLEHVQEAITEWGADAVVVLNDPTNRYGAAYGRITCQYGMTFEPADETD